ncbi:hypothetical protein [Paenibacillus phocaensis]|uniref:hypothetical protein n=1 Tax=Paenibacillus phocaensis TaxID=1776378 RepID=UPI000839C061|nr:hypothetical protein [Paenibacillus phocaensis]
MFKDYSEKINWGKVVEFLTIFLCFFTHVHSDCRHYRRRSQPKAAAEMAFRPVVGKKSANMNRL